MKLYTEENAGPQFISMNLGGGASRMVSFIRRTIEDVRRITKRFDTTHSHHKSYADKHRGPIEFQVGDLVFLKWHR